MTDKCTRSELFNKRQQETELRNRVGENLTLAIVNLTAATGRSFEGGMLAGAVVRTMSSEALYKFLEEIEGVQQQLFEVLSPYINAKLGL